MRTTYALVLISLISANGVGQGAPSDYRINEEQMGFWGASAMRASEPFVARIYKKDPATNVVMTNQPLGYPLTVSNAHRLKDDETFRTHQSVDFMYLGGGLPAPVPFKAGLHGIVRKAGDGPWRTIAVQTKDGSLVQYLHPTSSFVKVGQIVEPDTQLGIIGRHGERVMHLHVQAKDKAGNIISPDLVFRLGQQKIESDALFSKPDASELEFDPNEYCPVSAKEVRGTVTAPRPEQKWVSEIVTADGVEQVLGEFYDFWSASRCSAAWREEHTDSPKLTREREVKLQPRIP